MDYWVAFYEGNEVAAAFVIEGCPSEVVALSEAMNKLKESNGFNKWVFDEDHRIMICHLTEEDKESVKDENMSASE